MKNIGNPCKDTIFRPKHDQAESDVQRIATKSPKSSDTAEATDEVDCASGGATRVYVGQGDRVISLREDGANHNIGTKFLQSVIPGFVPGKTQAIVTNIHSRNRLLTSFHLYNGGRTFGPALPKEHASGGDVVTVSFRLLSVDSFITSLPRFEMANSGTIKWGASQTVVNDISLAGDTLSIDVLQDNPYIDIGRFTVTGTVNQYPGSSPRYGGVFVQFGVNDYLGRTRKMRIQFGGFGSPSLQIFGKGSFYKTSQISFDGFRLMVAYSSGNVATMYMQAPSNRLYALGEMIPYSGFYLAEVKGRCSRAFRIEVTILRDLEKLMVKQSSEYDIGRLGSEIAYVVATEKLWLKDLVIQEPSAKGRDLYTQDSTVAIQTRFLVNLDATRRTSTIQNALFNLVKKSQQDYANQDRMTRGFAILTYADIDGSVKALVLEVPRDPRHRTYSAQLEKALD